MSTTTDKGGARKGNTNAQTHGLRSLLTTGSLPPGSGYIKRITNHLRAALERTVAEHKGGEVSLADAATVQTAVRWERHAMLCQRWLRIEGQTLTPDQRLAFSRDIARASTERDKCIRALGIDRPPDPFRDLYLLPPATPSPVALSHASQPSATPNPPEPVASPESTPPATERDINEVTTP
jgi:hypothetical protein